MLMTTSASSNEGVIEPIVKESIETYFEESPNRAPPRS